MPETHLQVFTNNRKHIGHFDGEFFYTNPPTNLKVDGENVYTTEMPSKHFGFISNNEIRNSSEEVIFYLEP